MKSNTKMVRKPITAILIAAILILSVLSAAVLTSLVSAIPTENCDDYDRWIDTGDMRWIDNPTNVCQEKEQKEQEYNDYSYSEIQYCFEPRPTGCPWLSDPVCGFFQSRVFPPVGKTYNNPCFACMDPQVEWYKAGHCMATYWFCAYMVTNTRWVDTENIRNKPDGTVCGCTAINTLKECYGGTCTDTGICNSTICDADVACDIKNPGESCGTNKICNFICKCVTEPYMELYAGGSNPGYVYKYAGGTSWEIISPNLGYAVLDLVEYCGHLYATTMSTSHPHIGVGKVWRYDGGATWTLVGDNMDDQVCSLAVYQGVLYAGTGWNGMKLYRYDDPGWTQVISPIVFSGTRALHVSHGYLLMGDLGLDRFGRWDGANFYQDVTANTGSCIWDYEDYGGNVYAAAYGGRMWESSDATTWSVLLSSYDGDMWELEEFQNSLYMSYDNGELRASSVPDRGTLVYTGHNRFF